MKVRELVREFPELEIRHGNPELDLNYIQSDSRKIEPSDIFVLYPEHRNAGDQYISDALGKGAMCLLLPVDYPYSTNHPDLVVIHAEDPVFFHGQIASFLLDKPSHKLKVLAVTGTNGKTSITHILYSLLTSLGKKAGLIGTIYAKFANIVRETGYTTPDPSSLNLLLKEMLDAGVEYVCMEASSHGLKLGRLQGIAIHSGIFTNLTPDHLDFHPTMEDYLLSKFKLFELIEKSPHSGKVGLISLDTPGGKEVQALMNKLSPKYRVVYFGKRGEYSGKLEEMTLSYTCFSIQKNEVTRKIKTNLLGNFNFQNLSLAYILMLEIIPGLDPSILLPLLESLPCVPGRFEIHASKKQDRIAVVDYAHTPDALENILTSMKEIPCSMLVTIVGCGGDRDRKKRPIMGEIASRYSDFVIITSDNPRTENPDTILDEIISGIPKDFKRFLRIESRREAIRKGIEILPEGGFLLVAGKGHENYQIIGHKKFHFSDAEEIDAAFLEQ